MMMCKMTTYTTNEYNTKYRDDNGDDSSNETISERLHNTKPEREGETEVRMYQMANYRLKRTEAKWISMSFVKLTHQEKLEPQEANDTKRVTSGVLVYNKHPSSTIVACE